MTPERQGPIPGSEPEGSGWSKPYAPQAGVTFLAGGAYVRTVIAVEPPPAKCVIVVDLAGKWNHGATDTHSILLDPALAEELGRFLLEGARTAPKDLRRYNAEHPGGDS